MTDSTDNKHEDLTLKDLRPELAAFALAMERRLREHDSSKPGWKDADPFWLLGKLNEQLGDLCHALMKFFESAGNAPSVRRTVRLLDVAAWIAVEAADVANMAMMIADVVTLNADEQPDEAV